MHSGEFPFSISDKESGLAAPVPRPPFDIGPNEDADAFVRYEAKDHTNTEQCPADIVEAILSENAELFLQSNNVWGHIKTLQSKVPALQTQRQHEKYRTKLVEDCHCNHCRTHIPVNVPRHVARDIERDLPLQVRYILSSIREKSDTIFTTHVLPDLRDNDAESLPSWSTIDEKLSAQKQAFYTKSISNRYTPEYSELGSQLLIAYLEADYTDYRALKVMSSLVDQPDLVSSFTSRLLELAELASGGVLEYPGLLELVATRSLPSGESMQERIMYYIASDPAHYAVDFLTENFEGQARGANAKELNVGVGIMRLTVDTILTPEFGIDSQGYIERLARHWQSWPVPLAVALDIYTKTRIADSKELLQTALKPFVKQGRLVQHESQSHSPAAAKPTKKSKRARTVTAEGNKYPKDHDPEDIATVTATRKIDQFAYLVNARGTKGNVFRLNCCDELDELLRVKHVRKFLESHREEPQLEENVLTILQAIVSNPYDPRNSKKWATGYSLLDDAQPRSLYRFSPRDLPESDGGRIITSSRVLYGLVKRGGALTLALYGLFTKQHLAKQAGALPIRD